MSAITKIQWSDRTWNPTRGCSIVSPGCVNCYAMKQAHRFSGAGKAYEGLTKLTDRSGPQWTGKVVTVESALLEPLSWRTPAKVFVNSMSDLFHEDVPAAFIDRVFAVMALAPQHTFQILTKRPERMLTYMKSRAASAQYWRDAAPTGYSLQWQGFSLVQFPLPNCWLGVSVENRDALQRIDQLKDTPAAVRFVSFEPLLEHLGAVLLDMIHWAIIGGESGPGARRCDAAWVRSLVHECRRQHVARFVKQMGAFVIDRNDAGFDGSPEDAWPQMDPDDIEHDIDGFRDGYQGAPVRVHLSDRKGGDPSEWPTDLRVRQFPSSRTRQGEQKT